MVELGAYLAIGAITGFFAGLLGIGGGTIIVSSLALMFAAQAFAPEYVMHMAIGTSLAAIISGAWASFRTHHRHLAVDWQVVRAMIPGLLAGVFAGALFARFMNTAFLKVFFLAFMALIIAQLIFNVRSKVARSPATMVESVPALAPRGPPLTGASSTAIRTWPRSLTITLIVAEPIVDIST